MPDIACRPHEEGDGWQVGAAGPTADATTGMKKGDALARRQGPELGGARSGRRLKSKARHGTGLIRK
jgi:hypothetical protein